MARRLEAEAALRLEAEAVLRLEAAKLVDATRDGPTSVNVTGNESASTASAPAETFASWPEVNLSEPVVDRVDEAGPDVPLTSCPDLYAVFQWFHGQKQHCDPARYMSAYEFRARYH